MRSRGKVIVIVGLGVVVAVTTGLQAAQGGATAQTLRPYALLSAAMAGIVAAWQLIASLVLSQPESTAGQDSLTKSDPRRIGPYRIVARLGAGAMGRAYLGVAKDGRPVAVKVIRSEYADSVEFRRRFAREIIAIGRVRGQHTAGLVAADPEAEQPWMATSFVAGPSLQQAVEAHGGWSVPSVWQLAGGVADALTVIHAAGLVHRDLKPANILLTRSGPRIIDFGIAHVADASQLTATMHRPGTPAFMAPEQALGGQVGPAADVFALGIVLAYAATARTPFGEGASDVVLFRVIHQPPDLTGIEGELRGLIEACLNKQPSARPSPADVIARSRAFLRGRQETGWLPPAVATDVGHASTALRSPAPAVAPPLATRWRTAPALIAMAALLVALVAVALQFRPLYASGSDPGASTSPQASPTPSLTSSAPSPSPSTTASPSAAATLATEWVNVPGLVGLSKAAAIDKLQQAGLTGDFQDVDSEKPQGQVVSTSPAEGAIVTKFSTVKVRVSRANMVLVPKVIGMSSAQATAVLTERGLVARVREGDSVPAAGADKVSGQSPADGVAVPAGSTVIIYVDYYAPSPTP